MAATRTQKEIRQKAPIWLLALLFVNVVAMAVDARDSTSKQRLVRVWTQTLASPFQRATSSASGAGASVIERFIHFNSAASENERLKREVNDLRVQLQQARQATDENERLKGLLKLKEESNYSPVAARVIARDPSAWFNTVTISEGTSAGVELNMPVVTSGGIVGRVVAVGPWTATVMLI